MKSSAATEKQYSVSYWKCSNVCKEYVVYIQRNCSRNLPKRYWYLHY